MWLRAKTEANLKLELKMKVVSNTCDKELGGEMKFVNNNENYFISWKLPNVTLFYRNLCELFREKQYI